MRIRPIAVSLLIAVPALSPSTGLLANEPVARADANEAFSTGAGTPHRQDRRLVASILKINHDETVIAHLVTERATRMEIKALARQLISDLSEATRELRALAEDKNIPLPDPRSEAGDLKTWNEKKPDALDGDYLNRAQDALEDLRDIYRKAAEKSRDPDIRAFARKMLPAVEEQHRKAGQLLPR